jgi:hypothetical protein
VRGADAVVQAATRAGQAGADAVASWQDDTGATLGGKVDEFTGAVSVLDPSMRAIAARAERYGRELESAKTTITGTISANESTYAMLGNPLFGALGTALRQAFAMAVAQDLRAMIAQKAAALRGEPAQSPSDSAEAEEPSWLLGFLGDFERSIGDTVALIGPLVSDAVDPLLDGVGDGLDDTFSAVGMDAVGQWFNELFDNTGDDLSEDVLALTGMVRNEYYDVAQFIDGTDKPRTVYISQDRYQQAAEHVDEAKGGTIWRGFDNAPGAPRNEVLTVDRAGADARRVASTSVVPPLPGYDRDEFPPAVAEQGGSGSSVKYIDPRDNRGSGASMGAQLNGKTKSIERQLGGGPLGYGRADEGDEFVVETF